MNTGLQVLLVLLGAGVGSVGRFVVSGWIGHKAGPRFPWGTLTVNLSGCLALGLLASLAPRWDDGGDLFFVVSGGLIGGFTTFSTLMLETSNLALARRPKSAVLNLAANLVLGFVALFIGLYAGAVMR